MIRIQLSLNITSPRVHQVSQEWRGLVEPRIGMSLIPTELLLPWRPYDYR